MTSATSNEINCLRQALCTDCKSFVQKCITEKHKTDDSSYWIKSPLTRTVRAIKASAGECCWLCNNVLLAMAHGNGVQLGTMKQISMFTSKKSQMEIQVFYDTEPELFRELFKFRIATMTKSNSNNAHLLWNTGRKTWSEEACHVVKQWMQICDCDHRSCISSPLNTSSRYQPNRLIDLKMAASGILRLVCRASDQISYHSYAALSHCWGSTRPAMLKTRNLSGYLEGFSSQSLPKTYTEAITVCQDLNIDYLWIDSLCILQDSEDDWATESGQMGDIFSNAVLTIATPAARADEEGFIRHQNQYLTADLVFIYSPYGRRAQHYSVHREKNMDAFVNNARLNTRGWVLQERALSRRILYFAEDQIYWQCRSSRNAQFNLHLEDDPLKIKFPLNDNPMDWSYVSGRCSGGLLVMKWRELIEEYSRCNLTFASDTFMAVSGLASKIAAFGNWDQDDYLAGHWREEFVESLLWFKVNGPGRRQTNRAPSWSWASVHSHEDAQIKWKPVPPRRGTKFIARAIDCRFRRDANPRDRYAEGVLTVEGHLCEITIGKPVPCHDKRLITARIARNQWRKAGGRWDDFSFGFDHEDRVQDLGGEIFFMPLVSESSSFKFALAGLMLRPNKTSNGTFVRLGMAEVCDDVADLFVAAYTSACIEFSNYVRFDGKDKYTIDIA